MDFLSPKFIIFISLIFFFTFCNDKKIENKSDYQKISGKKFDLIDSLNTYSIDKGWIKRKSTSELKIVVYINGTCEECIFDLKKWKKIILDFGTKNIEYFFFVKTYNIEQIDEILRQIEFSYPVIIDYNDLFFNINRLRDDRMYYSFLLNRNNMILIKGNPILNFQVKKLYLDEIKKYNAL
jgi:hypothetical protein